MVTRQGPRVVEFNCRFGDPECQAIVPRLEDDILPLLDAVARGRGLPASLRWRADSSVCVVLASHGYPGAPRLGDAISGLAAAAELPGVNVFHAATALRDGGLVTSGGRVLGVQALGADIRAAIARAYEAVDRIHFDGMQWRRDIGRRALDRP
jgi:phosphoribosylamine--glycine ligase